jgi:hypothetical protein
MALYQDIDVASDFYGDIVLDPKGDLKIANSFETHKSVANFLLRTDNGDYAPDRLVGCNLGSFIGKLNDEYNQVKMEELIKYKLTTKVFNSPDVEATVVEFDENEVLAVVSIGGYYVVDNEIIDVGTVNLTYTFPYIDGINLVPFVKE